MKPWMKFLAVFLVGVGIGGAGGFAMNDYVEREDPDAIQQIRQELETQQQLDDTFSQLREQQAAETRGTTTP